MQFLTLLALLAPAIAGVSAKCETNPYNPSWPKDRSQAMDLAKKFCQTQLSGSFQLNGVKPACDAIANDRIKGVTSASFSVQWMGKTNTAFLSPEDCTSRLQNEIHGCERGGTSTIADWKFTSLPQYMKC